MKNSQKRRESISPMKKRTIKEKKVTLPPVWRHVSEDYLLLETIGTGSFGEIVKAKCLSTGRDVAIKHLHCLSDNEIIM